MGSPEDNLNMESGDMDLKLIEARENYREQFADNDWARFLVAHYKINGSKEDNLKIINDSGIKRDRLKATITFLKNKFSDNYPKATEFLSPKKQNITKNELSLQLINFIKLTVPHNCSTCEIPYFPYIVDNYDKTEIRCFKCSLPAHAGCITDDEVHFNRGIVFICSHCVKEKVTNKKDTQPSRPNLTQKDDDLTQSQHQHPQESSESSSDSDQHPPTKSQKKSKQKSSDSESENQPPSRPRRKRKSKSESESGDSDNSPKKEICRFFERGTCRYGLSGNNKGNCKFSHPPMCRKVLQHGTRGKLGCKGKCDKFHPKLCYAALNTKECFKPACPFWHIKGTKRSPDSDKKEESTPQETKEELQSNPFLGSVQSQVTQILQQQQEALKIQMMQFMQQMHQEMKSFAANQQVRVPLQMMQQTPNPPATNSQTQFNPSQPQLFHQMAKP